MTYVKNQRLTEYSKLLILINKMSKKICTRYNNELLESCLKRDNANCIQSYDKLNRETKITFICSCGKENCEKNFRTINEIGAFCKECTFKNKKEKIKQTCIKRFGVESSFQSKQVKEKIKQTCLLKYGTEYPSQSEQVKEKIKQTCLENLGVEYPSQSEQVKEKFKQTCINNFGVENPSKNEEIKEKRKQTCITKFGVEYLFQNEKVKEKFKQTCINNFGVENPLLSEEVKEKIKETNLEKFGVENPFQNEDIKQKMKDTNLKKFGVENPSKSEEIKEKIKQTCLVKFGVEYAFQSEEVKQKIKQTNLQRFGVEYPSQNEEIAEKTSKNAYRRKEVITPSGKTITFQGYEPFAYKILLETYEEEEIITSRNEVPEIWWNDHEGKKHRYFVDFFIKKDNLMIEIKSQRTFSFDYSQQKIEKTLQESRRLGYNMELWILDPKGNILQKIFN